MNISLTREDLTLLLEQLSYATKQIQTEMCTAYDNGQIVSYMLLGRVLEGNQELTEIFKAILEENK